MTFALFLSIAAVLLLTQLPKDDSCFWLALVYLLSMIPQLGRYLENIIFENMKVELEYAMDPMPEESSSL